MPKFQRGNTHLFFSKLKTEAMKFEVGWKNITTVESGLNGGINWFVLMKSRIVERISMQTKQILIRAIQPRLPAK